MNSKSTEIKGLIYESFVNLALEKITNHTVEWHPKLKGLISEQDFALFKERKLILVVGVTYWGSHEAAKMKFWRIHEDIYEVFEEYSEAIFLHILFEKNLASDDNLVDLINEMCAFASIYEDNSNCIKTLKSYVSEDEKILSFGSGKSAISFASKSLELEDEKFRLAILDLSNIIQKIINSHSKNPELLQILSISSNAGILSKNFHVCEIRETFFKPALIALLNIGVRNINNVFDVYEDGGCKPNSLRELGLLKKLDLLNIKTSLTKDVELNENLKQLLKMGRKWCIDQLYIIDNALQNTHNSASSLYEHYRDITNDELVSKRIKLLTFAKDEDSLREVLLNDQDGRLRCWPLDYFVIIQRDHTKGKKYGFKKLSSELNIPYIGGISPLSKFASGNVNSLSKSEISLLCNTMCKYIKGWEYIKLSIDTIQKDRRITLMKKLSVLDLVVGSYLSKQLPSEVNIQENFSVRHPLAHKIKNKNAGRTDFNFKISWGNRQVYLFVVSTYEATHKHKEVSGRLRAAWGSGLDYHQSKCLLLVDGNFLIESTDERVKMLASAGWNGAFYFDELNSLVNYISNFLFDSNS
ncbi:hypothetical protein [Pseudanabaena sp. UWO310]|uniref:hypothetical protein n=1 Tax=Pseudanabaena sp. UWO310 TaxID=2480795 RepID=UPI001159EECC|nr:hypothetical protein [Pseudanabaena sp. UWO310]TYQ30525.1 hypothetical protein PseudUWO310_08365 [Pseudanabaena sp. UWO310]